MSELRQNLGDSIESPRFIETIPKRGYRLIAPVSLEAGEAPAPSIAVLPFANMAPGIDQEYFCDGLAEDLTNALTRLRGLRVIARTSAFASKGKAAPALPMSLGMLGCTWAKRGRRDKAEAILRQLERLSADRYITPSAFAFVHAGLEDTDAVLDWYQRAFGARDGVVTMFGVDPGLDWLRADPRFQALLQRLHLPQR